MEIVVNKESIILDIGDDIIYAKGGAADGGLQECEKSEATHIWNRTANTAYMNNDDYTMIEVTSIPENVTPLEYKYVNNEFVVNEEYVPYVSAEERISMLEDVVNMLLLN